MVKQYLPWADQVRVIAVISVILLHVSAVYVLGWSVYPLSWWWVGNLVDALTRMAVPLFVMLSGALLLPKAETTLVFYAKRVVRVVLPWLFWASTLFCYQLLFEGTAALIKNPLARVFNAYITSYWYVVLLVVVYLVVPWVKLFIKNVSLKIVWLVTVLLFIFSSLLSVWIELFNHPRLVQLAWLVAFLGYFTAGYGVRQLYQKNLLDRFKNQIILVFVVSWMCIAVGTWLMTLESDRFIQLFYDYGFMPVIVQGLTGFSLILIWSKKIEQKIGLKTWQEKVLKELSKLSYGIFLTQSFISAFLLRQVLETQIISWLHPLVVISVFSIVTLLASYVLVRLFSKLPVLRLVV